MSIAVQETCSSEMFGGQGADFLRVVAFGESDLQVCQDVFLTGAAPRMTWLHFFAAGAVLQTDGMEKSQNALV